MHQTNRRSLIRGAALATAGATLTTGAGCASARAPIETPRTSCGPADQAAPRVLVGYATRTGSTIGVAQAIGDALCARGWRVVVAPLQERPSLEGLQAVVLGSAVHGAQWLPEAMAFLDANKETLAHLPVAAFCVHAMNLGPSGEAPRRRHAYLDSVRTRVSPVAEAWFPGIGPTASDSAFERWLFKAFGGGCEGDCRDWPTIRAWGAALPLSG